MREEKPPGRIFPTPKPLYCLKKTTGENSVSPNYHQQVQTPPKPHLFPHKVQLEKGKKNQKLKKKIWFFPPFSPCTAWIILLKKLISSRCKHPQNPIDSPIKWRCCSWQRKKNKLKKIWFFFSIFFPCKAWILLLKNPVSSVILIAFEKVRKCSFPQVSFPLYLFLPGGAAGNPLLWGGNNEI